MRREVWESRAKAEAQISRNGFFSAMDPRVLKSFLSHALTDLKDGKVKLTTPKAQEAWSYVRGNFHALPENPDTKEARNRERMLNPHLVPGSMSASAVFTRPEGFPVLDGLEHLRPRALYIYGDYSHLCQEETRKMHTSRTGIGAGGNGGIADGGVEEIIVEDSGHLCVFDKPKEIAVDCALFLDREIRRWRKEREFWATVDTKKSKNDRTELSDRWIADTKLQADLQRPRATGEAKL
jgi:pimeloyl-ACP methyl ester carboxylesterase